MNPRDRYIRQTGFVMVQPNDGKSQFDLDLENAKDYFGDDFPGNDGLTCIKCGAAVNLGWQHIAWHEAAA